METKPHVNPLIIIGMHRSGTSMVTRLLDQLGLLVGARLDANHEAFFFLRTNEWLLQQGGGDWLHPERIESLLQDDQRRAQFTEFMAYTMQRPRVMEYMGVRGYVRHRSPYRYTQPWGWKDPRNTFTLPMWLDVFPAAKVLHVYRHGVDVASSMAVRQDRFEVERDQPLRRWPRELLYSLWPYKYPRPNTPELSLSEAFALWEVYMQQAEQLVNDLPSEQAMAVQYEELLQNPVDILPGVAAFAGLSFDGIAIDTVSKDIKASRAYAFRKDATLAEFYDSIKVSPVMKHYGYAD